MNALFREKPLSDFIGFMAAKNDACVACFLARCSASTSLARRARSVSESQRASFGRSLK